MGNLWPSLVSPFSFYTGVFNFASDRPPCVRQHVESLASVILMWPIWGQRLLLDWVAQVLVKSHLPGRKQWVRAESLVFTWLFWEVEPQPSLGRTTGGSRGLSAGWTSSAWLALGLSGDLHFAFTSKRRSGNVFLLGVFPFLMPLPLSWGIISQPLPGQLCSVWSLQTWLLSSAPAWGCDSQGSPAYGH